MNKEKIYYHTIGMNAIILAGGFGSRLKPLTDNYPKPMLPIANRPMLDYVVSQLSYYGTRNIVFTLGYMPEIVKNHAERYTGISCSFSTETTPLGTAGGVKKAEDMLDDLFFVISGDALSDVNLGEMARKHLDANNDVTIAAVRASDPTRFGVLKINDSDKIDCLIEKPKTAEYGNLVSSGIYLINKRILSLMPRDVPFDFAKNLFPPLIEAGKVGAYIHEDYWCDIGDKKSYYNANFYMSDGSFYPFVSANDHVSSEIKKGNLVSKKAIVVGKVRQSIIGENARIASSADVDGCIILPGATVKGRYRRCIVGENFCESIAAFDRNRQNSSLQGNKISYNSL